MRRSRAVPIAHRTTSRGQVERERRRRDRAILQLWRDGWTGKKIAAHLGITPAIVGNVTHKHGAARHARTSPSNGRTRAPAAAWESYRVYFWRVMDGLFRQADERGGRPPPFVTIPEPADEFQREQITQTIEWWARQAFDLSAIEIRIAQGQRRTDR
jgi:hypothetical protein